MATRIPALITLDWGTSSLRANLLDALGGTITQSSSQLGVMQVTDRDFAKALHVATSNFGDLSPELPVIAAGMIGSVNGWQEAAYLEAPAGMGELAARLQLVEGSNVRIVPGVAIFRPRADFMRGEEVQALGALELGLAPAEAARMILPGTHSKWVTIRDGKIVHFKTFMSGELFSVLLSHSILGRYPGTTASEPNDGNSDLSFLQGIDFALESDGLASCLFSARSRVLAGHMDARDSRHYLSGIIIGDELKAGAVGAGENIVLVGDPKLCRLYALALSRLGVRVVVTGDQAATAGLWKIAQLADLVGTTN